MTKKNSFWSILKGVGSFWPKDLFSTHKSGLSGFWPKKTCFGRFRPKEVVLVDFGWKNWVLTEKAGFGRFWPKNWSSLILAGKSVLTEKTGFGRFWPNKVVLVDFDWKNWFLTEITGFGRFSTENNWFWSTLDRKMWLWLILGHFGSLGFSRWFFEFGN